MEPVSLDNRGLLSPEPMVRILRALESLTDGQDLIAIMDREPLLLYRELERRGFTWTFDVEDCELRVRRSGDEPNAR